MQETQREVRTRPLLPTAHSALDATEYEPQRFDWARDVNDSLGLSPIVDDNSGTIQDTLQSIPANTVPVDPNPGDVGPNVAGVVLASTKPTNLTSVDAVQAPPTLINPDPGDKAVNPNHTPTPVDPASSPHTPVTLASAVPIYPAPVFQIDCAPSEVTLDPVRKSGTQQLYRYPIRAPRPHTHSFCVRKCHTQ